MESEGVKHSSAVGMTLGSIERLICFTLFSNPLHLKFRDSTVKVSVISSLLYVRQRINKRYINIATWYDEPEVYGRLDYFCLLV